MSKIGDLFVRLGLKSDDYKRGMADAKKETTSFSQGLGKMKAGALAVWAAIGTSVIAFARDFVSSSNKIGDKWAQTLGGMKQSWTTFKAMLTNWDFKNFGDRIAEAFQGGKEGAVAKDELFEVMNTLNIARAKLQTTLDDLYFAMTDPSQALEDRIAAGRKYLSLQKGLYDEEIALMKRQKEATINTWLSGSGINASAADVETFFGGFKGNATDAVAKMFPELYDWYMTMGDATNKPVVDAILAYDRSLAQFASDNRRIIRQLNTLGAQDENGLIDLPLLLEQVADDIYDEVENINEIGTIKVPPIDTSNLDKFDNRLAQFTDNWQQEQEKIKRLNQMVEDSIISATTNGLQAFTDMMFGLEGADATAILTGLMQPFADTAGQLGGMLMAQGLAVEAFKTSLSSLQGAPAIAAGAALLAVSAAMKSGIKALASNQSAGGSTSSYGGSSIGSATAQNYESTLTINVVGSISGSDIALSLDRTKKKQGR